MMVGEDLEMQGKPNNVIRHALYKEAARMLWGHLGKHQRKELPLCVTGDIRDAYPKKNGEDYVGFKTGDQADT